MPGVPAEVLIPRDTWADKAAYDDAARKIAHMFHENFEAYASGVSQAVRDAGPIRADDAGEVRVSAPGRGLSFLGARRWSSSWRTPGEHEWRTMPMYDQDDAARREDPGDDEENADDDQRRDRQRNVEDSI